jgi:hypothetical protein
VVYWCEHCAAYHEDRRGGHRCDQGAA